MIETVSCAITGCREACPKSHLMCVRHWRMVPAPLRRLVLVAFKAWQQSVRRRGDAQTLLWRANELRKVQQQAIAAVIEKEIKRDLEKQEGQLPLKV